MDGVKLQTGEKVRDEHAALDCHAFVLTAWAHRDAGLPRPTARIRSRDRDVEIGPLWRCRVQRVRVEMTAERGAFSGATKPTGTTDVAYGSSTGAPSPPKTSLNLKVFEVGGGASVTPGSPGRVDAKTELRRKEELPCMRLEYCDARAVRWEYERPGPRSGSLTDSQPIDETVSATCVTEPNRIRVVARVRQLSYTDRTGREVNEIKLFERLIRKDYRKAARALSRVVYGEAEIMLSYGMGDDGE